MECGFDTIGNATLIAYDKVPLLVTDPWIEGSSYFGSWGMSCDIPEEQRDAILKCPFVWFSHGHPDHLNPGCLHYFKDKIILLPMHYGERIKNDLDNSGFNTKYLVERVWTKLSERVSVLCITNANQDAILLLNINNRLIVNLNDVQLGFERKFIKNESKKHNVSIAMGYAGYGDADMIHIFDEEKNHIPSILKKIGKPLGDTLLDIAEAVGSKYFVPFSAMHRYERTDSNWANDYIASEKSLYEYTTQRETQVLPMYLSYNCMSDTWNKINTKKMPLHLKNPEDFGDSWSDELSSNEKLKLTKYIQRFDKLKEHLDFVNFEVGGKLHTVPLAESKFNKGVTFQVPRHSLMTAVDYEIFDDLLIGNFMKTILHGKFNPDDLYQDYSVIVAKYGDNARVTSKEQVREYLKLYARRHPIEHLFGSAEEKGKLLVRKLLPTDSALYTNFRMLYRRLRY